MRAREFETRGLPPEDLLRRLDAVVDYARGGLPRLRLEDLEEERRTSEGKPVTRGWALLHALEHAFMHLGHVQITAQMWRKNSW